MDQHGSRGVGVIPRKSTDNSDNDSSIKKTSHNAAENDTEEDEGKHIEKDKREEDEAKRADICTALIRKFPFVTVKELAQYSQTIAGTESTDDWNVMLTQISEVYIF